MNDLDDYTKGPSIKMRLTKMISEFRKSGAIDNAWPMIEFVLMLNSEDSMEFYDSVLSGHSEWGTEIYRDALVKGAWAALPTFLGFNIIEWSEKTCIKPLDELNQVELIKLVRTQNRIIAKLYENRQRL